MSNPTNPFSWQMPTATDLVTDLPADFEVFGQAVATSLADLLGGTTGQVLSKASNADMDFTWATDASGIPATIFDAKGDLIVASAADTAARLASSGSNGNVLTVDTSTATGLKWAAPAGGGKVLQVVSTAKTDSYYQNGGGWADVTGLSVSITPTSASSKIMVFVSLAASGDYGSNNSAAKLVRDSTDIFIGDAVSSNTRVSIDLQQGDTYGNFSTNAMFLDSPATTSATTYKIQTIGLPTGGRTYVNQSKNSGTGATGTRTASSITVMEIGA